MTRRKWAILARNYCIAMFIGSILAVTVSIQLHFPILAEAVTALLLVIQSLLTFIAVMITFLKEE